MHTSKNIIGQVLPELTFILFTLFFILSCTQNKPQQINTSIKPSIQKPIIVTIKKPIIVRIDTCPQPRNIIIPQKQDGSYIIITNDSKTFQIRPPEIKPANSFVPMQNYTTKEGLPLNLIISCIKDKKGNLWFGTAGGGVSRYDGKLFTNFSVMQGLGSSNVFSMLEDKSGIMWFGTLNGVSCYDGKSFTYYAIPKGLADNAVLSIVEDKNSNLWFGTRGGGIYKLKKNDKSQPEKLSFTTFTTAQGLVNNDVLSILEDKNGNLLFGTRSGISLYDGKSFTDYKIIPELTNSAVRCMLEDKNKNIWFGTNKGVFQLNPDSKSYINLTNVQRLASNIILNMLEDEYGNIWFCTAGGISHFNPKSLSHGNSGFTSYTTAQGLANTIANCVLEDNNGNLWFGTENGALHLDRDWKPLPYGNVGFLSYTYTSGHGYTNNSVTSILEDKNGDYWFGTLGNGVSNYDGKSFTNYTVAQGLANNIVRNMIEDKAGNVWFATDSGVSRLDRDHKSFTNYTTDQGLVSNKVRCLLEDKAGNIWFGTWRGGLSCLDKDRKFFMNYTTEQGLANNVVRNLIEDKKGNIWCGTLGGGLSRIDSDRKFFSNYTTKHGLITNYIWNLFEDNSGNLWLTTEVGVSRFDGESFINYTAADGMGDNGVGDIVIDKKGTLWLGTNKGLTALKGYVRDVKHTSNYSQHNLRPSNQLSNYELKHAGYNPVFEIYSNKTGHPVNDININGMYVTPEGIIWAGTSDKLIRFDYSSLHKNPNPPNVFIQSIKINNQNICWSLLSGEKEDNDGIKTNPNITEEITLFGKILTEAQRDTIRKKFGNVKFDSITRFYPLPVNLVLPYTHNNLTLDFAAIEPAKPFLVRYQYILEGYDRDWSPAGNKTSATFGNIYEGSYTFKVKAQSPDGIWSDPVSYSFKVLPPWYRTWWAYTLFGLIFIAALWCFIKWRERGLKKEAELKQQKTEFEMQALRAQMNPHFIFNSLNSISRFILKNQRIEANDYLIKFSRLIRMILHNSTMPTVSIAEELNVLQLYLELECLRFEKKIIYEFQFDPDLDTELIEIPPLLLQPYIENAIWHGLIMKKEEGHLWIKIEQQQKYLVCTITDDGIGRKKAAELKSKSAKEHKSMGMNITASRIALLNQSKQLRSHVKIIDLILEDGNSGGTQVIIKLPLYYD